MSAEPNSPLYWLDRDDIIGLEQLVGEDRKTRFSLLFGDYDVNRPTQVAACSSGYQASLEASGLLKPLTKRQRQALRIAAEISKNGRTDIGVAVGHELGISVSAATKLLQRAQERLEAISFLDSTPEEFFQDVLLPVEEYQVQQWMRNHDRPCAGSGRVESKLWRNGVEVTIPGCTNYAHRNYALCYHCHDYYGVPGEWEPWLVQREKDIDKEHRQNAISTIQVARLEQENEEMRLHQNHLNDWEKYWEFPTYHDHKYLRENH